MEWKKKWIESGRIEMELNVASQMNFRPTQTIVEFWVETIAKNDVNLK